MYMKIDLYKYIMINNIYIYIYVCETPTNPQDTGINRTQQKQHFCDVLCKENA